MALVQPLLVIMEVVAVVVEQVEELKCFMKMHRSIRLLFHLHVILWMAVRVVQVVQEVVVTDFPGETDQPVLFTKIKPRISLWSRIIQQVPTSPVSMTREYHNVLWQHDLGRCFG